MMYLISITTIMILFLVMFLSYTVYKYRNNQILHLENLHQLTTSYEKSLLEVQLEIQEKTLEHLARELHDNCNQKLTLAKLHLNTLNHNIEVYKPENKLDDTIDILSNVIQDLSDLSHSMSSQILFQNGLVAALQKEIAHLKRLNAFEVKLDIEGDEPLLETTKELVIFRIAQEAIHNIIKHSKACNVNIYLQFNDWALLKISDDGIGFDRNKNKVGGIGLQNMAQRTKLLNGEFQIYSEPSKGTIITSKIPLC